MKDTSHAEPAEALGPQHAGALLQTFEYAKNSNAVAEGDVPNAAWKLVAKNPQRGGSCTQAIPTNTQRWSQPRGVLHITNCTHRQRHQRMQVAKPFRMCNSTGKQLHRPLHRHWRVRTRWLEGVNKNKSVSFTWVTAQLGLWTIESTLRRRKV